MPIRIAEAGSSLVPLGVFTVLCRLVGLEAIFLHKHIQI